MSITKKATAFLLLTFTVGWTALILSWWQGHRELSDIVVPGLINVFSPAFAALACSIAFEKGQRLEALGLSFRPNWWWLWAALIPMGLAALTVLIATPFEPYRLMGIEETAQRIGGMLRQRYSDALLYVLQTAGVAAPLAIIGFAIFFSLSEELGWRGYLYRLWRRFGFWRYSLAAGAIWGVWHWPLIYLFGLNYPDHRELGLFIFPIFTALFSAPMTLVRDRGGSVWAAGIMHGTLNAMALMTTITFVAPQFPWTWSGLSGVAAMALGALLVALFQRRDVLTRPKPALRADRWKSRFRTLSGWTADIRRRALARQEDHHER